MLKSFILGKKIISYPVRLISKARTKTSLIIHRLGYI